MSFSFEFQIFSLPLCCAVRLCSEQARGSSGKERGMGRLSAAAEQWEFEFDLLSIRQKRRLRAETTELESRMTATTDDDSTAENFLQVIFNLGSSLRSGFAFAHGFIFIFKRAIRKEAAWGGKWEKGNHPKSESDTGVSVLWAFKRYHLQHAKLISFKYLSAFLTFILGALISYYPRDRVTGRKEAGGAENGKRKIFKRT